MKYKEQEQLVADLRALADFYERPESIELPKPYLTFTEYVNVYDYTKPDYPLDYEASKAKLKRFVRALGSCEKNWGSSDLSVTKRIGKIRLNFLVNREAVCTKKVVGTKKRPKTAYVEIPNEYVEEEVVEWVCDDVALLS